MGYCNPGLFERLNTLPSEMAEQTAIEAFTELGLVPGEDRLGLAAFVSWYKNGEDLGGNLGGSGGYAADEESYEEEEEEQEEAGGGEEGPVIKDRLVGAQDLLGLNCVSVDDLLEILSEAAPEDTLSEKQFLNCLRNVAALSGKAGYGGDSQMASQLGRDIYASFDLGGGDAVDFAELTSGLSVLCSSDAKDKLITVFTIHDSDGDGHLSFDETVHFVSCVFKVLFVCADLGAAFGISAEELAVITVGECFKTVELREGLISVGELLLHFTGVMGGGI